MLAALVADGRTVPLTARPRVGRIRHRRTFEALARHGRRARYGPLALTWLPDGGPPRVGYAVGRRVGTAVARNRLRRRLRALVREHAGELPAGALVVNARADAVRLDHAALASALRGALGTLRGADQRAGDGPRDGRR